MRRDARSSRYETRTGWQAKLMPYNDDDWRTEGELVDFLRKRGAVSVDAVVADFDIERFAEPAGAAMLPADAPALSPDVERVA